MSDEAAPIATTGRLYGVGVGPGDPELLTLKAARLIQAAAVVAYPTAKHGRSIARAIAASFLRADQIEVPMVFPVTVEAPRGTPAYDAVIAQCYDTAAATIAEHLDAGRDVAVLCEGDPFFYGSFMYLYDRLAHRYPVEVVPGVTSVSAAAAVLGKPSARQNEPLLILPGTLPPRDMEARLQAAGPDGAVAVIKLGSNFTKVRTVLTRAGYADRAMYVARATMAAQQCAPLKEVDPASVPYFSLILAPGQRSAAVHTTAHPGQDHTGGSLIVAGLGPGGAEWITPEVQRALAEATDLVGYRTYLDRLPRRPGQQRHCSDNREEAARARQALTLAAQGRRVVVVSSGDPGIFAMATAVMEAIDHGPPAWRMLPVRVFPGISAMQAAAARVGAPLGHDFCAISLSDRLKPWSVIVRRLEAAGEADMAIALYNPASSQRTWQLAEAKAVLLRYRPPATPVVVARDVGGPAERIQVLPLSDVDPTAVDMRTIVLVGASNTRSFERHGAAAVYTPRHYEGTVGGAAAGGELR